MSWGDILRVGVIYFKLLLSLYNIIMSWSGILQVGVIHYKVSLQKPLRHSVTNGLYHVVMLLSV